MNKIIYIADPEIIAIPIIECGEPLIDVVDYKDMIQYGLAPENELTTDDYTKMRKTVFDKLCQAQKDLPFGYRFRLYEGFRSLPVQNMLFEQEYKIVSKRYPNNTHVENFHETTRLASPVTNLDGTRNIPPHNTGAAIDVELITEDGELVDMGMTAAEWYAVDPSLCLTHCDSIDTQCQKNRQILLVTMEKYGFVNYPNEWWHFSYGDRYWAFHKKQDHAIYGSC